MSSDHVHIKVNGVATTATLEPRVTLVDFLRDTLDLTGTHVGCEHGVCGACSVLLDGKPVRSCLMFAVQADGMEVVTVEGLCNDDGSPGDVQDAFWETHGLQCGYCTPGMVVAAQALLDVNPDPDEGAVRDAIEGNLCRCTGYVQIVEAVLLAAKRRQEGST